MKVIPILLILLTPYQVYFYWLRQEPMEIVLSIFVGLWSVCVFFLANSKIDADEKGIRITAPYGVYALNWSEVKAVETTGLLTRFYGDNKALTYTLLLVGKGKRDLKALVAEMVQRHQIERGRPPEIKESQLRQMRRNAQIRGWKLF